MYKIAICDDDSLICSKLEKLILDYRKDKNIPLEVEVFYDGASLKENIQTIGTFDIIFLDIEMEELSGIELGKYVRSLNDELTKIVYISSKQGYAMDLFQVRPIDFMVKPIEQKLVYKNLDKCIELIGEQTQYLFYKIDQDTMKIKVNEILYFESENRVIHMHTLDGIIDFYGKLEEITTRLDPKYFWRVHKSYIINYMHVKRFRYTDLDMENGTTLRISQTYRKEIRDLQNKIMNKGAQNV